MTLPERIPTEIVQLFASAEAWNYRLVPYDRRDGIVLCAGEQGRDYASASQEIEVLSGFRVQIQPVGPDELSRLLNRYYRREETRPISGRTADLSRIGSGQGFLTDLIGEAFDEYASDIHFEPYEERCRIRLRIDGKLIEKYVLDRSGYASIVNQIKIMANLDISERRLPQDGRILYHRGDRKFDLRVSSLPTIYGEKVVLRLLTRHAELLELSNLGFSERQLADYESAIARPHGMALITGPTGSGKSTTLYATLRRLNRESGNILTIEDPVEYTLEGVNQVQLKEEIGLTFGAALRTFLRQDPDIIMLGEIRDADTAAMAIRSSLTGHLVFSTIHTNSAWGSVSRLRDMGVHPYLLNFMLLMTERGLATEIPGSFGEYEKLYYDRYKIVRATATSAFPLTDEQKKQVSVYHRPVPGGKTAVTRYRTLETRGELSLLEVELLTGRTHQIRATMADLGCPLLGDGKYGDGRANRRYGETRQALYSYRLTFDFPTDAGILGYLRGRSFQVDQVPFRDKYFG